MLASLKKSIKPASLLVAGLGLIIFCSSCQNQFGMQSTGESSTADETPVSGFVNVPLGLTQVSARQADRVFMKSYLDSIFGSTANAITTSMILDKSSYFEGPCDPMEQTNLSCGTIDNPNVKAELVPLTSTTREGQRLNACEVLSFTDSAITYAIQNITGISNLAYLTSNPIPTDSQIQSAFNYFYRDRVAPTPVLTSLKTVALTAQQAGKPFDPWRYVLLSLCYSTGWQLL